MRLRKSEAGVAMPLVLMVMIVLVLLGTALWQYSISELNQSVRSEQIARAYYLARAGAETVAIDLVWNPEKIEGLGLEPGASIITKENTTLDGTITVEIKKITEYEIDITGTGTVEGVSQSVTLRIAAMEPFDGVMYSNSPIVFPKDIITKPGRLTGNIVSGGKIYTQTQKPENLLLEHPHEDYTVTHDRPMVFPEWEIPPSDGTNTGNFTAGNNSFLYSNVAAPLRYNTISINNHRKLTVEPTTYDLIIFANDFLMENHGALVLETNLNKKLEIVIENDLTLRDVSVKGNGLAVIYVRSGEVNIYTTHANIVDEGAKLLLILGEGVDMVMQANSNFEGLVYGPGATVKIQGNTSFTGSMIVNQVQGMQNLQMNVNEIHHAYSWEIMDELFGRFRMVQWIQ